MVLVKIRTSSGGHKGNGDGERVDDLHCCDKVGEDGMRDGFKTVRAASCLFLVYGTPA